MKAENGLAIILVVFLVGALFTSQELSKQEEEKGIIQRLIEEISTPVPEEEDNPLINLIGECPHESDDYECPMEVQITIGNGYEPEEQENKPKVLTK